jgi:hypothetical protein
VQNGSEIRFVLRLMKQTSDCQHSRRLVTSCIARPVNFIYAGAVILTIDSRSGYHNDIFKVALITDVDAETTVGERRYRTIY